MNFACTVLSAFIVTVHVIAFPEQAPLQPANTALLATWAVNVTWPEKLALHALPQLMPAGLLVTVPFELPEPPLVTVSVNAGGPDDTTRATALPGPPACRPPDFD